MRVLLVDDHPLFLEGLEYLLETHGIGVVGIAKNSGEALEKSRVLKPDIILMDIRMPGCSGLDTLRLIKAEMPDIKVIMLTTSEEDTDLFEAIKYGASGYLLKNIDAKELVHMLTAIEQNEAPLSPSLAAKLIKEFKRGSISRSIPPQQEPVGSKVEQLTDRQLEILELVARGNTYKEVGGTLGLAERTVKYHMERILEQLHLEKRAQVIAYAARMGMVADKKE